MRQYEIVVIGGGPAGLAAAIEARHSGAGSILVIERDRELGAFCSSASTTASAFMSSRRSSPGRSMRNGSYGSLRRCRSTICWTPWCWS